MPLKEHGNTPVFSSLPKSYSPHTQYAARLSYLQAMNLFDPAEQTNALLPFTFTRPIAACRLGAMTIAEKWEHDTGKKCGFLSRQHLSELFKPISSGLFVNGSLIPSPGLCDAVTQLSPGSALWAEDQLLALNTDQLILNLEELHQIAISAKSISWNNPFRQLRYKWDLFKMNGDEIHADFNRLCSGRTPVPLPPGATVIGDPALVFLEKGASVQASVLNTTSGPVYLAADAEIMEGCLVRGPLVLGEHAALKMGAKVYGPTTLGPHCKAGGELNNVVFFGYSNKAHDGFLGNSVIGEWCNLGADTNNSNLKNNYGLVDVYDYASARSEDSGLQFCGLMMGDHSKCGINTMFNTGTVVGVSANIFGSGFPPKFIPSFSWGGAEWIRTFLFDKAMEVARRMMERRGLVMSTAEEAMLRAVFDMEEANRKKLKA